MPGQVQIAVVEAGLGGATDATNVFSPKMLHAAIITALGREHERALGRAPPRQKLWVHVSA